MERLTKKHDGSGSYTQFGDKYIPNHNIRHKQCVEKLGKLEDIEQELGIPLEVLFKALKDGIEILETTQKVRVSIRYSDYFKKWQMRTTDYYEDDINLEKYGEEWY